MPKRSTIDEIMGTTVYSKYKGKVTASNIYR